MDLFRRRRRFDKVILTVIFAVHFAQVLVQTASVDPYECCSPTLKNSYNLPGCCVLESCLSRDFSCADLNGTFFKFETNISTICAPHVAEATTIDTVATTDDINNSNVTTSTKSLLQPPNFVCVESCPAGYYDDLDTGSCTKCNVECTDCTEAGTYVVTCNCTFGDNGTNCCGVGFRSEQNGNVSVCVRTETTDAPNAPSSSLPLAVIIGASAGVAVVLIIIIVVVVCCCCRRERDNSNNKGKSRPISASLKKSNEKEIQEESIEIGICVSGQAEHQNVSFVNPGTVARQAQNKEAEMFRYAKDPTNKDKKKKSKRQDVSSMYENKSAIKLQQNLQNNDGEENEIENLPMAPPPPTQKRKKSMKERISRKFKSTKKNPRSPEPDPPSENLYLPMDAGHTEDQEVYVPMTEKLENPLEKKSVPHTEDEDQAEYMNQEEARKTIGMKNKNDHGESDGPTEDYENFNFNQAAGATAETEEEQDDYENFTQATAGVDEEPEDYENWKQVNESFKDNPAFSHESEDQSPYANVEFRQGSRRK